MMNDENESSSSSPAFFRYLKSLDLRTLSVRVKICTLEGVLHGLPYETLLENPLLKFSGRNQSRTPDLMVRLVATDSAGRPLHVPIFTAYKSFSERRRWEWNEWVELPLKYSDLPRDALLMLTVFDVRGPKGLRDPVGGTTVALFGKYGVFRQGQIDLRVWNDVEATLTTSGKDFNDETFHRLTKLTKRFRSGKIPHVDWLDRLTFAEVERIKEKEKHNSNFLFLMIEFPRVHFDGVPHFIVHYDDYEDDADEEDAVEDGVEDEEGTSNEIAAQEGGDKRRRKKTFDIIRIPDYEINEENLVEAKHHKLARSQRTGQSEKELKPNAEVRNRLNEIVSYPKTQVLSSEEKDLVWRYRFYLAQDKKALSKFIRCVNWRVKSETALALDLIANKWAPMDVEDALELLGPDFRVPGLRHYAVSRMRQAPDEDLRLYLLQLVQALKYENENLELSSSLESSLPPSSMTVDNSSESSVGNSLETTTNSEQQQQQQQQQVDNGDLTSFLIDRASKNSSIANYFYWYLITECEDEKQQQQQLQQQLQQQQNHHQPQQQKKKGQYQRYHNVLRRFMDTLRKGSPQMKVFLDRQNVFMEKLVNLLKIVARESGNRQKKIDRLQTLLADPEHGFIDFAEPMEFPLDPEVKVKGVIPNKASLYKSSLMPARISFVTENDEEYVVVFKLGDDLRQDQLIIQIITLMDRILRQENLDLKLTPYRVLATSTKHGFVQCIASSAIAEILTNHGSIQSFFRKYNPSENGPYGIKPEVMDTYVKSCAGYCVITYLLGVGDRHLDNLLLTRDGRLIHIDFGYILGRDPKPLPPPMKLSKEMIEAFGGINSDHYSEFRKECYSAFLHLRRYANLILNLFSLMVDANVPDIALEPDKTVRKVQDKFRLDLSDEEAVHYMQSLIDISATAVLAAFVERLHRYAQFWRN